MCAAPGAACKTHNNVNLVHGQLDFFHLALDEGDLAFEAVDLDNFFCLVDDVAHVDANDKFRTGFGSEHG